MKTITVYTLEELKEVNSESYFKVLDKWKKGIDESPWTYEIIESLKEVIKICGGKILSYSIGPFAPSHLTVYINDEDEDEKNRDYNWFINDILNPLGYDGKEWGLYKLTGCCFDDEYLCDVAKSLKRGLSIKESLEDLAHIASRMIEEDLKYCQSAENMEDQWHDRYFTEDGIMV